MSRTILLADDSLTIQKVVELTFADTEYQVVALSSGDELLERMREFNPDLVICDVIMPGKDGYEVCQEIKSDPAALHIPVVLLSGTFEPFDRDKALAAGCSEIITKPFEARKLVDTVDRLLEQGPIPESAPPDSDSVPADVFDDSPVSGGEPVDEIDFGTRVTTPEPAPDEAIDAETSAGAEGLDFTETGFDEMKAASEAALRPPEEVPEEGIDFEMTAGVRAESFTRPEESLADFGTGASESGGAADPFVDVPAGDDGVGLDAIAGDPFDETEPSGRPAGFTTSEASPVEEPFTEADRDESDFAFADAEAATPAEPTEAPDDDEPSEPRPEPVAEEAVAAVPDTTPGHGLSDEDVDRIARRVIELATERIEQVAWEVIPDMAEIVVRERIRQLEADVDGGD
jgi:CheY-like chemotaxis protein